MDRYILSKLSGKGVPDRVNIPCLMHDTHLCQLDVTMTNNYHGTNKLKYKTCQDIKTGVHNIYVQSKDQTPEA